MKTKYTLYLSIMIVIVVTLTPGNGKVAGNYLDKVAHFAIFYFLAYAILKHYSEDVVHVKYLLWAMLAGLITEILQQFIPGRNMDIYDGLADNLGIISAYYWSRKNID